MKKKKKSLLITWLSVLALLFSIGGAIWFAIINVPAISGTPNHVYTPLIHDNPAIYLNAERSYYAGEDVTSQVWGEGIVNSGLKYTDGYSEKTITGKWTLEKKSLSGATKTLSSTAKMTFTPNDESYMPVSVTISDNINFLAVK